MQSFTLRPWKETDLDSLVKYANNERIAMNMMNAFPHPYEREHGIAFIRMAASQTPPNILAIDINGEAAGGIGIHPQQDVYSKNAEMGYWLAEPYWGKGIMGMVIPEMVDYAFSNWDIERIFARPYGRNLASQKVLEKAGFTLEARLHQTIFKNLKFEDELIYAIRRNQ